FAGKVLLILIIVGLEIRFPRQSVVEISEALLGKVGGALVSFLILWSFLHIASLEVRIYTEMIITGFLTETPIVFLTAMMVLTESLLPMLGSRSLDVLRIYFFLCFWE
ncbi:MAG: GerAB/ArcD/ProY family transporter, partial [Firmicutes bacterium]|nr:GerAB/ArcD/ProY family transporter [Bacillota bacterium]